MFSAMKALRYYGRRDMRMEDVPIPEPADDEARLRIMYASICQTDVERWWHGPTMGRWRTPPRTVGHETAGRVDALGTEVKGLSLGDRVMVNNIRPLRRVLLVHRWFTVKLCKCEFRRICVGRWVG